VVPALGRRVENYHLPKTDAAREELARVIAADGERLLAAVDAATDQPELAQLPTVVTLSRVWAEQYTGEPGQLRWREVKDMPSAAELISSPYDTDARYSTKRGVVAEDPNWQARAGEGFDKGSFVVDWDREIVICPAGKEGITWLPNTYPQNGMVYEARFARKDCTPCPSRALCTKAAKEPRIIGLQAREHHEALQGARREQETEDFRSRYAARAGVEGDLFTDRPDLAW
jgi:hypothetical protein